MTLVGFRIRTVLFALLLLIIAGCGSSGSDFVATTTGPNSVTPAATVRLQSVLAQSAIPSQVVAFRATGYDQEQNLLFGPVSQEKATTVEWTSVPIGVTDFVIEYLDANGQVVALSQAVVTLRAGETLTLSNLSILGVSSALESLALTPANLSLAAGTSSSLQLIGRFSDGSSLNLTSAANWNSTDVSVGTVNAGTVQGVEPGTTTVRATFGGKSAETQVTVTDATLVTLSLSPNSPAIASGTSQPFTVEGYFSDGTFDDDMTADVEWASSNTSVATITEGTALAVAPGQTTISVTFEGKSASTVLTVTSATLESLEITGAQNIAKGTSTPLTLTGHFSDDTSQDLTSAATWSSDSVSATVVQGVVRGEAVESSIEISAIYDSQSAAHTLSVTDAVAVSVRVETVTANDPTLVNIGSTLGLKATAVFSDETEQVVTNDAAWSSSNTSIATVNTNGVVTGLAAGQSDISATYDGKAGTLRITTQVVPLPDLVLQSGNYTFNTESGVLSQGGNPIPNVGWNSTDQRLVLNSLTINTGATLTLEGANPFKVRATEQITIDGEILGIGTSSTSGEPGGAGKAVNLFCGGDLTGTGIIDVSGNSGSNGGNGGNGGRLTLTTAGQLSVSQLRANGGGSLYSPYGIGGNGGNGGEVSLNSQGTLSGNTIDGCGGDGGYSGSGSSRGGNGGNGGKISLNSQGTLSDNTINGYGSEGGGVIGAVGGYGGNGGNGGEISLVSQGTLADNTINGYGGYGGIAAPAGNGGYGGNGGEISLVSQGTLSDNTINGDGGNGGNAGIGNGGNGGNGGNVTVTPPVPSSGISVAGGARGSGRFHGTPGANGTINGVTQ